MLVTALLCAASAGPQPPRHASLPIVRANDNRLPAGRLHGDTLRLTLVVQMATWRPEAEAGPAIDVAAFAEGGKAPEIPGPLIRVPTGTVIDATVRNALGDSTIVVHGLVAHPAPGRDGLVIRPGGSGHTRFPAGAPGTYFYFAKVGVADTSVEREQLAGAFIVDSDDARPDDRIFVINIWGEPVDSVDYRNTLTVNGRSFPYDERITATLGDTVRWRWINASLRNHPMHLHGFFFRVDAKGDAFADTLYAPVARRMAVTEDMRAGQTMSIAWAPNREGNWLFHCHIGFHVVPDARLDPPPAGAHEHFSGDVGQHMAGLVVGISVRPPPGWHQPPREEPRAIRLFVQEGPQRGRAPRALGYVIQRDAAPPARDSVEIPGAPLVLTQGEPTDVTVLNRLPEPTTIHWHGLELESYSDGVAGWSGAGPRAAPAIQPGDSFTAHLTLQRAGTFIYHTHLNDYEQLTSGLYGAIVVLQPNQRFDPATDHVFVVGWDGPEDPPHLLVNGDSLPPAAELASGVAHRFRFVNIGMAGKVQFSILGDSSVLTWRARAKDGADLPPEQATLRPATTVLAVGETADFTFLPPAPGRYRLALSWPGGQPFWSQALVVR